MTGEETEPQQQAARAERRSRRAVRSRRWRSRTLLVVALVTVAAVGIGGWSLAAIQGRAVDQQERAVEQEERAELSEANARIIAEQVTAACGRRDEIAELLGEVCQQAEQVAEEPAQPVVIAPTDEQLRPLVQQYTEDWLARNPPPAGRDGRDGPTVAEIADVAAGEVARQLAENPPQDGRTPTPAEIRPIVVEVVNAYLQANPPPAGQDGQDGQPGRDGADGRDGVDGAPGEPPMSWTFTHTPPLGPPTTYECRRTDPFDPSSPTYECAPVAP